jgi:D-alanyl-D-alanine-carboxypeptidase/D-alanyl-D-alanine-endopeptidase
MQLLDRYLNAVRFWLPNAQKNDIIAELSEDLQSAIAEREEVLCRSLADDELAELLKQRGHPIIVASGYMPRRSLIGPALFPIYAFVLKIVGFCFVVPWVVAWGAVMFYVPSVAKAHPGVLAKTVALWDVLWLGLLAGFAIVTIVFAVVERIQARSKLFQDWDPKKLPPSIAEIPRGTSTFELAASLTFGIWWIATMSSGRIGLGSPVEITPAPPWPYFFWGFLGVTLLNVVQAAIHLMRPYWTPRRAVLRLAGDASGAALFCWMLKAGILAGISVANVSAIRTAEIVSEVNRWAGRALPLAIGLGIWLVIWDARRILRLNTKPIESVRAAVALVVMLFILDGHAGAQLQTQAHAPAAANLPSDDEIRHILADRIDVQHKSVGMVVGITSPAGRRIISYGAPTKDGLGRLSGDTVFEIGSVTKIFTALLLADMVERGDVALADPVVKYLPSGTRMPERNGRQITLVDLATHTSGLPFFPPDVPLNDVQAAQRILEGYGTDQLYAFLASYELPQDIGTKWGYSNVGFAILGQALARRASTDYEALVRSRITKPLGMASTTLTLTPALRSRLATGYDAKLQPAAQVNMPAFLAAGCLRSSTNDLLTFLDAFLGSGESRMQPAMHRMLETKRPGAGFFKQALGWWLVSFAPNDDGFVFFGGQTPGYSSAVAYDPKTQVGIVVLSNDTENDGGLAWHLMRASFPVQSSEVEKARTAKMKTEIQLGTEALDHFTGKYRLEAGPTAGDVVTIERITGLLVMRSGADKSAGLPLHAQTDHSFFAREADVEVTFITDAVDGVKRMVIRFAGADTAAAWIGQ